MSVEKKEEENKEGPLISWEEIAKHTDKYDCWMVINGEVYDVTNWWENHPGGIYEAASGCWKVWLHDFLNCSQKGTAHLNVAENGSTERL